MTYYVRAKPSVTCYAGYLAVHLLRKYTTMLGFFPHQTRKSCQLRCQTCFALFDFLCLNLGPFIIACGDGPSLHHASLMHDILRSGETFCNLLRRLLGRTFASQIYDNAWFLSSLQKQRKGHYDPFSAYLTNQILFCSNFCISVRNSNAEFVCTVFDIFFCKVWCGLYFHCGNISTVYKNVICHFTSLVTKVIVADGKCCNTTTLSDTFLTCEDRNTCRICYVVDRFCTGCCCVICRDVDQI